MPFIEIFREGVSTDPVKLPNGSNSVIYQSYVLSWASPVTTGDLWWDSLDWLGKGASSHIH